MSAAPPLVERLDGLGDPAEIAARFVDLPWLLLLESASAGSGTPDTRVLARYSFLSADPSAVVRSKGRTVQVLEAGTWREAAHDPLDIARGWLREMRTAATPELPPFQGGVAGYIGYDYGAVLERIPPTRYDDLALPDVVLGRYEWLIAWDHAAGTAWLIAIGARAAAHRAAVLDRLASAGPAPAREPMSEEGVPWPRGAAAPAYPSDAAADIGLRSTFIHRGYLDAVSRVREYIVAGDIFQANLSQRFQAPLREPPFDLYRRLRKRNPAPFAAYLGFGDVTVLSASPERFLRLEPDGQVETRPIKGTRPRGLGPMHDAALGRALAESEKDRAENVMIVDLLRNDLSRVCRPGTVRVPELFALEQHPTVHHLVSTVVGELDPGADAVDLIRASFPGGSITGAPKVRAMEIIAELEPSRRGVYCGSIGYLSASGAMDTSIVIRTFVLRDGEVYFQAGGGIVADSDPELEYRETLDKAAGLIATLSQQEGVSRRKSVSSET
jgi:para-aminobenzoate synthetase component I